MVKRKKSRNLKPKKRTGADSTSKVKIRVIGIGGGGGSIVSEISLSLPKVDFVAANTDKRSLKEISKKIKVFQFGEKLTGGFGTGMDPEIGKNAASEEKEKIKKLFEGQDICILVASLGGGSGSGAAPIFAKAAKEAGCIVYGIFTMPFGFEGSRKMEIAKNSLEEVKPYLNAISVLPNENIFKIINKDTPLKEALSVINMNLSECLRGLIEAIYNPGLINIDFADLRTVLEGKGKLTYLNASFFDVSKGIEEAIKKSTLNPFYSYGVEGASGILLNIVGSKKIGLSDVSQISKEVTNLGKRNATVILGIAHDDKYGDKIKIMVLAVGCEGGETLSEKEGKKQKNLPRKKETAEVKEASGPPKRKSSRKKKKKIEKSEKQPLKKKEKLEIMENKSEEGFAKVDVKVRRNALEIKKAADEAEEEILKREKKWETPAFLRRNV